MADQRKTISIKPARETETEKKHRPEGIKYQLNKKKSGLFEWGLFSLYSKP